MLTQHFPLPDCGCFLLEEAAVFDARGRDVLRYLQSRTTNDIKALGAGETCLAAALDAQGRTEGLYTVLARDPGAHYLLVSDGGDSAACLASLLKFRVADQVQIESREGSAVLHFYGASEQRLQEIVGAPSELILLPSRRGFEPGYDLIIPKSQLPAMLDRLAIGGCPQLTRDDALGFRILGHRPSFPAEVLPGKLFLEAGLAQAISSQKGCYAGQEVIEKALARGRAPRLLKSYSLEGERLTPGTPILSAENEAVVGEAVATVQSPVTGLSLIFARIKSESAEGSLTTGSGTPLKAISA